MAKMKDSGVEWIGKIPNSWNVIKGKYIFKLRVSKGNSIKLELLSPTQNYGVIPQTLYEELSKFSAVKLREGTDLNEFRTVHKGDFCISLRSFQGGFEYSDYEGVVSPAYQVFFPIVQMYSPYYKFLFKTKEFIAKINSFTLSLRDGKNISFDDFSNSYIPHPTLNEQKQIADFLDKKCAEIDSLSEDIQKEIDLLEEYKKSVITEAVTKGLNPDIEMKDSGVEYIGTYPSLWTLKKLKYTFKERNERSLTGSELLLSVSQYKGVIPSSENSMRTMQPNSLIGYKKVYKDDLVFNKLNPTLARFGKSEYEGITSPEFSIYIIDSNQLYPKFLEYILRTEKYSKEYGRITLGVGDGYTRLYTNQLGNVYVAVPSLVEQEQILLFLKSIIDEIDKTLSEKKEQLTTLAEYKKSLIYEYVTGKKEVI